jgi:hypothetical protein
MYHYLLNFTAQGGVRCIVLGVVTITFDLRQILRRLFTIAQVPTLLALGLILTYASSALVPFARADDYPYSLSAAATPFGFVTWQVRTGRALQGVLSYLTFRTVPGVEYYYLFRIVSLIGIVIVAWQLYREFHAYRVTRSASAWLAFSLCAMPAFIYYAVSAATMYVPYALALGILSGQCARRIALATTNRERGLYGVVCLLAFAGATLIYEPAAMGFWIPVAMFLFGHQLSVRAFLKRLVWQLAIFGVVGAAMYVTYALEGVHDPARTPLSPNLLDKFVWFLGQPLAMALNLFVIPSSAIIEVAVGVFIGAGFWLYLRGNVAKRIVGVAAMLITLPLSFLPHLISAHIWPIYRTQVALTSLLVLYGFFALRGFVSLIGPKRAYLGKYVLIVAVPAFAVIAGLVAARSTLVNVAVPNIMEFSFLKGQLAKADLTTTKTVYVIRPHWGDSFAPEVEEEFGAMTSYWEWGAIPMVKVALEEQGYDYNQFTVKTIGPDEELPPLDNSVIIDMRQINSLH